MKEGTSLTTMSKVTLKEKKLNLLQILLIRITYAQHVNLLEPSLGHERDFSTGHMNDI